MKKKNEKKRSSITAKVKSLMERIGTCVKKKAMLKEKQSVMYDKMNECRDLQVHYFKEAFMASRIIQDLEWKFQDTKPGQIMGLNSIRSQINDDVKERVEFIWKHNVDVNPAYIQLSKDVSFFASSMYDMMPDHVGIESNDYKKLVAFIKEQKLKVVATKLEQRIKIIREELEYFENFNEVCVEPKPKEKSNVRKKSNPRKKSAGKKPSRAGKKKPVTKKGGRNKKK